MLNTLNTWVVVSNDGMSYIPSHEAIAGDGMNIAVCGLGVFILVGVHAFMCFCIAKNNIGLAQHHPHLIKLN
jgi:hypothetical protein